MVADKSSSPPPRAKLLMTQHSKPKAHQVHELLLEAHPQTDRTNLIKAVHLAETTGAPRDHLQLETVVAISKSSNGYRSRR